MSEELLGPLPVLGGPLGQWAQQLLAEVSPAKDRVGVGSPSMLGAEGAGGIVDRTLPLRPGSAGPGAPGPPPTGP